MSINMTKLITFALWMGFTSSLTWAQPVFIVTEAEAAASLAAGGMLNPRNVSQPGSPQIEFLTPDISKPVTAPTSIDIRFVGNPPSEPKPDTFRVLYGSFRIDITQRLLGVAKVSKDGIKVKDAVLPKGRHQLALMITDSMGRQNQQVVAFTVE